MSESNDGSNPWKYVDLDGLQELLLDAIDDGFTFPLNPKWVLVDPGWKRIYDRLIGSDNVSVQESLNAWFPPGSGIRERIHHISRRHPPRLNHTQGGKDSETERDLAMQQLERYITLRRAKAKLRAVLIVKSLIKRRT